MKASIITFHNTSNFGATLQCLALYIFLSNQGLDVEVINYLPSYVRDKKGALKELKNVSNANDKTKAMLKGLAYFAHLRQIMYRDSCFEEFVNQNLKLSHLYLDFPALMEEPPKADLYICGSDQIWNPALTGGALDEAFFLRFTEGIKVAYGASIGEFDIEKNSEEMRRMTEDFSMLSVRENSVAERLSRVIYKDVRTVLDPTLLLDMEDYARYEKTMKLPRKPYLLYYSMQKKSFAEELALKLARIQGLDIVDISPNPLHSLKGSNKMFDIGPSEFLTLYKNASFVVTNSFHGTIFSIIYRKQFISTLHSTRGGRVVDLLTSLDLTDRIARDGKENHFGNIDYEIVYPRLNELRKESYSYLSKTIESYIYERRLLQK